MTLHISSVFTYDEDAGNYIQAVEAADEAASPGIGALEPATRKAINNFVIGCKQDGIWSAIKASCILAGARTLQGALVPLAGADPTSVNFAAGDYNRKTGLTGDGSTKYLDSNRNNNADPQNSNHNCVYVTQAATGSYDVYMGLQIDSTTGGNLLQLDVNAASLVAKNRSTSFTVSNQASTLGLKGTSRANSSSWDLRSGGISTVISGASATPASGNLSVYATFYNGNFIAHSNARIAFYSIGESLDLAKLDGRVTDLITAFGAAIP